jgi:spore coat polysaccharide biosynthesis protein SpsF (cytidylyltransferase family)/sialic acid synthase SpsE
MNIIAEVAGGHEGNLDRCLELVRAAHFGKADIVKFQFYFADELCTKDHPDYQLFRNLEFSLDQWKVIYSLARELGLKIFADIFGPITFSQATELGSDGYKIHSADLDNLPLLTDIAKTGKVMLLGVGGHKRVEIYQTLTFIRSKSENTPIVLMPGHQLFPTPIHEHSLEEIRWFKEAYKDLKVEVGCADHIDGDHPSAPFYPIAALGAGATYFEKHLTMRRAEKKEDYESAIEPEAFLRMAETLKQLATTTSAFPRWTEGREKYRKKAVKTLATAVPITEGSKIEESQIKFLRIKEFSEPLPLQWIAAKKVKNTLPKDHILKGTDIHQKVGLVVNARTASTRLPSKALLKIQGKETLALLIERMKFCKSVDQVVLATSDQPRDDVLADLAKRSGIEVFRGSEEKVAERLLGTVRAFKFDHFVRVTGDDLLRDVGLIDEAVKLHLESHADYTDMKNITYGCDSEVISHRALATVVERATKIENTEYLTWYLDDASSFVCRSVDGSKFATTHRLTLDTQEDFQVFTAIFDKLYQPGKCLELNDALHFLNQNPLIANLNQTIRPKFDRSELDVSIRI